MPAFSAPLTGAKLSLPERLTRFYFRLFIPLFAVSLASGAWGAPASTVAVLLVLAGSLLAFTVLHLVLPARWSLVLRVGAVGWLVLALLYLALFSQYLNLLTDLRQYTALLLLTPLCLTSLGVLFFDRPRLGQLFAALITCACLLILVRWEQPGLPITAGTLMTTVLVCILSSGLGQAVAALQQQADRSAEVLRRDALTGLLNRHAFEEFLRQPSPGGTLAVLDIDHFKVVNDTYGHDAGDRVLRGVADVLLDQLGASGAAYRWGGEEFVVFIQADNCHNPVALLENIRREIAQRSFVGGSHITLSGGLSHTQAGESPSRAFSQADRALLQAKQSGRNRLLLLEPPRHLDQTVLAGSR